jgi:hypothetical protein
MDNLDSVISDYLQKQTNYAVLITGKWGVGKTYYYKHTLSKTIADTDTITDASNKYKSIHISLFGLTSIEDIQTQIFLSLHPFLKTKAVKLSVGLGKSIARGMLALKNLGKIDDYISDVKPDPGDWINLEQLVICFDDLERKSKNLPLEEMIGFINSLVENNDAKIILVANEDKIDDTAYKNLKEKVIGVTVEFLPDFKKNVEKIIEDRYSSTFKSYASFLSDNINLLLEFSSAFDNNLRVLIFALDNLHRIYSEIKTSILDIASKKDSIIKDKLEDITRFTIATSIEYKNHSITFRNRKEIDKSGTFDWSDVDISKLSLSQPEEKVETEKTFRENFIENYYKSQADYKFFESIYAYVTGANQFLLDSLVKEIDKAFHIQEEKILPQYEVLNQLDYRNYYNLTETQYREFTRRMVEYAEEGAYKIGDYLTVFHFAIRFDNILNYSSERLKQKIQRGLRKGKPHFQYVDSLDFYLDVPHNSPHKTELLEIRKTALAINNEVQQEQEKKEAIELLNKISIDWDVFKNTVTDNQQKWLYKPLFRYASVHKIYLTVNQLTLKRLREFADFIRYRYREFPSSSLKAEIPFLEGIKDKLTPSSKTRKKKNIRNHLLNLIYEQITTAIDNLKKV